MYDITRTRMLLTTAVFAAVAAVFAGGAKARIPNEEVIRPEPVAAVTATVAPLASSRLTGLLSSLSAQERSYLKSMTAVCSVGLCQPDELLAARLGYAMRADSAPTYKFPECQFDERHATCFGFASRAGSAPRYKFRDGYRGLP